MKKGEARDYEPVWLMTFDAPVYGARAYPMELSRRDEGLIDMAEVGQAMDDAMKLTRPVYPYSSK